MNFIEEIPLFGPGAKVLVGTSLPLDQFCVYILPALPYTASVYEDTHGSIVQELQRELDNEIFEDDESYQENQKNNQDQIQGKVQLFIRNIMLNQLKMNAKRKKMKNDVEKKIFEILQRQQPLNLLMEERKRFANEVGSQIVEEEASKIEAQLQREIGVVEGAPNRVGGLINYPPSFEVDRVREIELQILNQASSPASYSLILLIKAAKRAHPLLAEYLQQILVDRNFMQLGNRLLNVDVSKMMKRDSKRAPVLREMPITLTGNKQIIDQSNRKLIKQPQQLLTPSLYVVGHTPSFIPQNEEDETLDQNQYKNQSIYQTGNELEYEQLIRHKADSFFYKQQIGDQVMVMEDVEYQPAILLKDQDAKEEYFNIQYNSSKQNVEALLRKAKEEVEKLKKSQKSKLVGPFIINKNQQSELSDDDNNKDKDDNNLNTNDSNKQNAIVQLNKQKMDEDDESEKPKRQFQLVPYIRQIPNIAVAATFTNVTRLLAKSSKGFVTRIRWLLHYQVPETVYSLQNVGYPPLQMALFRLMRYLWPVSNQDQENNHAQMWVAQHLTIPLTLGDSWRDFDRLQQQSERTRMQTSGMQARQHLDEFIDQHFNGVLWPTAEEEIKLRLIRKKLKGKQIQNINSKQDIKQETTV
ncbi:MAG: hypothetical protein EZS28_008553 [Streblomastix strix]|uniref:Uncharacterized protein n=1 Tax=Streblomastix strix TaxID=222440 RepID=A0A5J4WMW0_9EUKA|nr:MAG: hypothetical protein EZS28_008553 [Streblomastix strix]